MTARLLMAWMRLLVVALSFHVGGLVLATVVADDLCAGESDCCSDCPMERSGQECPPGCPNCQCHHGGGAASIPAREAQDLALPARSPDAMASCPHEASSPREPILPGVFRPPRALPALT